VRSLVEYVCLFGFTYLVVMTLLGQEGLTL
jgi:hypothetical protein